MGEYTEKLRKYFEVDKKCTKIVFKVGRIYRGVNNGRFTLEEALTDLNKKVGVVNER